MRLVAISRQRVQAIARAAGMPRGGRGGGTQPSHREGASLLSRVRELAAAAGEEPGDYLEDAARCRAACERIVADVLDDPVCGEDPKLALFMIRRLAIDRNPPELAAQVRAVVEAASTEEL